MALLVKSGSELCLQQSVFSLEDTKFLLSGSLTVIYLNSIILVLARSHNIEFFFYHTLLVLCLLKLLLGERRLHFLLYDPIFFVLNLIAGL
mgnify:CR=1 FL=1